MTIFVTALAALIIIAFFGASVAALILGHLERMAEIAREESE